MPAAPEVTPAALADEWRQLMRSAEEPDVSDAESRALIDRADQVLSRLVETPTNIEAAKVSELLFRPVP
jgi:hypothetical protein